jgi:hypothetical protein
MSRPFTYSPSHLAMIDRIRDGATIRAAAGAVGIPESTWHSWRAAVQRGTCADADVVALVTAAMTAYNEHTAELQKSVAVAAASDWKAAAWALDHRRGDPRASYDTKRARYEAEVAKNRAAGTHVERHEINAATDEALLEEARALAAALRGDGTGAPH